LPPSNSGRLLLGQSAHSAFRCCEGTDRPHDTGAAFSIRLAQPESFRLVQAFSGIDRPNIRRTLMRLIEQIAAEQ
jgi:hypothetical protein